ncbi:MAG: hypothetical protein IJ689_02035 [Alphaproteobacteria bacterium]|nr:hypothetical protein [Alphaproteobacteria bacterium]
MIEEPLLKDNILSNIYHNFAYWLNYDELYYYLGLGTAIIIFLSFGMAAFCQGKYPPFIPEIKKEKLKIISLLTLVLSFGVYLFSVFAANSSVFSNFDMMTIDYIDSMKQGIKGAFHKWRFTPLHGVDYNLIFAISSNTAFINIYIAFKQLLILYLLNIFLSFLESNKRLLILAVINLVPAVFQINSTIFPEQNIAVFVLLSLILLVKYQKTSQKSCLLWFAICMNLAIYSKETVILFYFGILLCLILQAVISGKITLNKMLHPLSLLRQFPIELIMVVSMFVYTSGYMLLTVYGEQENRYLDTHSFFFDEILRCYAAELILNFIALAVMLYKTVSSKRFYILWDGLIIASGVITAVIFYLQIAPVSDTFLSYYLYLPAMFCVAYILGECRKTYFAGLLMIISFLYCDYQTFERYQGKDRKNVAEFITDLAKQKETFVYMQSSESSDYKWWKIMAWSSALKYSFPDTELILKSDFNFYKVYQREKDKFIEKRQVRFPQAGDYVLANKIIDPDYEPWGDYQIVYENKSYVIYYLKDKDD